MKAQEIRTKDEYRHYFHQRFDGMTFEQIHTPTNICDAAKHGFLLFDRGCYDTHLPSFDPSVLLLPDSMLECASTGENFGCHKYPTGQPSWLKMNEKGLLEIDEALFVRSFIVYYDLKYINGAFYDQNGYIDENTIKQRIYRCAEPFVQKNLSRMTYNLLESVKASAHCVLDAPDESKIFISDNQVIKFDLRTGAFSCEHDSYETTINRLNISYDPDAECPTFSRYICDLLHTDDLATLQEFMGYCLIPSTRGQVGLFIKGEGGEGKSVLTHIMKVLFDRSLVTESINKLETNRFLLASLENKLVIMDDDLDTAALKETGTIKTVITATTPLLVERKGVQPHEARVYARLFCLGNHFVTSAFDRSDGFYRRQLLLTCKPIRKDRVKDVFLKDEIVKELPGVFNWMLYGLQRLVINKFEFTKSERLLQELAEKKLEENPMLRFVVESGWVAAVEGGAITSKQLLTAFRAWCNLNAVTEPAERTITTELKSAMEKNLPVEHTKNLRTEAGKCVGFKGCELTSEARRSMYSGYYPTAHAN